MPLVSSSSPPSVSDLGEELRRRLASRDSEAAFSVEFSLPAIDPMAWLHAQLPRFSDPVYWHGREEPGSVAAVGVAFEVDGLPEQAVLDALGPEARLYGAGRFRSPGGDGDVWRSFGGGRFLLPRAELRTERGVSKLRLWLAPPDLVGGKLGEAEDVVSDALNRLTWPPFQNRPAGTFTPVSRHDAPSRAEWMEQVELVLAAIASGPIEKVVLARRAVISFGEAIDPLFLLQRLARAAPGAFYALVPDGEGRFFLTASPERLLRVSGGRLHTEALAGTGRAGEGGGSLLDDGKDVREHAFVEDAVLETVASFCSDVHAVDAPTLFQAVDVQHLRTPISGTLRPEHSPLDVVRTLHPTPAVGGTPPGPAMAMIQAIEGFDRGLYAGPVGWIGRDAADLAVGIRSGLVDGNELVLHSGAGIVAGSVPAAEWEETELKLGAFLNALQLNA